MINKNSNICLITFVDDQLNDYLKMWVLSIRKKYGQSVDIIVGTTRNNKRNLDIFFNENNVQIVIINTKILKRYASNQTMNSNKNSRFQFLRIEMFNIVKELFEYEKIIYSDVDIYFHKKISPKYLRDDKNYVFRDFYTKKGKVKAYNFWKDKLVDEGQFRETILKLVNENKYFNSGLIIINNKNLYKEIASKILNSSFNIDDQTIMNYYNDNNFTIINDIRNNYVVKERICLNPRVIHLSSYSKPILKSRNKNKWYFEFIYYRYGIKKKLWHND